MFRSHQLYSTAASITRKFLSNNNKETTAAPAGIFIENISPALPGGQTSWDLTSSDLTIFEASSRSFTVSSPASITINLYGGGGGNYSSNVGGRGGRNQGIFVFQTGTTYWVHLGGAGSSVPAAANGAGGGGSSAVTLAPPTTGTEILVAGGGGGSSSFFGGAGGGGPTGAPGTVPPAGGPLNPPSISGGGASGSTGGAAGSGRRTATPGGNAPRGVGGTGSSPAVGGAGGPSGYASGGTGGFAPGDSGGGGGGGGYAGGGGANNGSGGGGGGGGNGYTNPLITSPSNAQGGTFPGDPTSWGDSSQPGAIRLSLVV